MPFDLTRRLLAGALAVGLVAGGPALATTPGAGVVVPAQAEATAGWNPHTALGLSLWLPPELEIVNSADDLVVFASRGMESYGEIEVIVTTMPDAHDSISSELASLPPHLTIDRGTRTIPGLGPFEEIVVDARNEPDETAIFRILAAPEARPGADRLMILIAGYENMYDVADWDILRTMIDDITSRLSGSDA